MQTQPSLHQQTTLWVTQHYTNADHLVRTEEWVRQLDPQASEALQLAALTHDMERAFPGPDSPHSDPSVEGIDHAYNRAHAERSARIVATFLHQQGAEEALINAVAELIRAHEYGGWPEANILQAADSLSFLEINVERFLRGLSNTDSAQRGRQVRAKFAWMYERIQIPAAYELATPLHAAAQARLEQQLSQPPTS